MQYLYFLAELILLYLLSQWLVQSIYKLIIFTTNYRPLAISFLTIVLFPGTVVHELAHLFTAEILGVKTGKLTLVPESIQGQEIRSGSVAIAQTGPFRRALIGLAPFIVGIISICAVAYFLSVQEYQNKYLPFLLYYLLFAVSNSMFPSPVDLRGTWQLTLTILILVISASIAGIKISLSGQALVFTIEVINVLIKSLGIVLAVNIAILLIVHLLTALMRKITRRSIKP